jgi:hypothetical protein
MRMSQVPYDRLEKDLKKEVPSPLGFSSLAKLFQKTPGISKLISCKA